MRLLHIAVREVTRTRRREEWPIDLEAVAMRMDLSNGCSCASPVSKGNSRYEP
jgi:hypothetical protein